MRVPAQKDMVISVPLLPSFCGVQIHAPMTIANCARAEGPHSTFMAESEVAPRQA
jgi:hypothetical protein